MKHQEVTYGHETGKLTYHPNKKVNSVALDQEQFYVKPTLLFYFITLKLVAEAFV